uniref:Uncharacterized protein n=1 Tax=Theileria annulata TaxID=5874 RepID=A0A3B0MUE0_THEAN
MLMYNKNHLLRICRAFAVSSRKPSKAKKPDSTEEILEQLQQYDTQLTSTVVSSDSDTSDWKPSKNEPKPGFVIPTKFRIGLNQKISQQDIITSCITNGFCRNIKYSRDTDWNYTYTDFSGLRYPTLDTSRNRNYWKESRPIIKEFSLLHYIKRNKLCNVEDKRIDLPEQRLQIKEASYRDNVGYIHTSNEQEDHELEYKGDKDTADWVYRQSVIAESMNSFPYPSTR